MLALLTGSLFLPEDWQVVFDVPFIGFVCLSTFVVHPIWYPPFSVSWENQMINLGYAVMKLEPWSLSQILYVSLNFLIDILPVWIYSK